MTKETVEADPFHDARVLTPEKVASYLGLEETKVRAMLRAGTLPGYKDTRTLSS